ncbi:glycosyltransferase, family 2 [Campylobacter blaseri]|uniref:Glycosyl transferase family 2 n=1 Tax=Campylobacter blaseri TaxID=2042961 RepID=A0A2P8QZS3_9BACT|nr:glycosyltransferase [Campylobacter blaseri]PSM51732.1 glycosyl transferase family 2 [Campylobacter blaseri]PSM53523.1 glycosyl transferase family 2 [Campylobacter blaseri]QKF86333.1 glycosyltransferase, family 2 [Campylobacter blaseri]
MSNPKTKFSVLMSIYYKETPEFFNKAMQSIWDNQTLKPDEIILVKDGPLTAKLDEVISIWQEKIPNILKVIALKSNLGLGDALNIGLKECSFNLVARMDTDDISMPDRFKKQIEIFKEKDIDICSSWAREFDGDETNIVSYKKVPKFHKNIIKFSKSRNPLNHPATMYKKEVVKNAGGYKKMLWFEDYYLWARMIINGAKFYNIQEPLVDMRAGFSQLKRRKGLKYALYELRFQKELLEIGFINIFEFIRNVTIRFIVRILPKNMVKCIYKLLRK